MREEGILEVFRGLELMYEKDRLRELTHTPARPCEACEVWSDVRRRKKIEKNWLSKDVWIEWCDYWIGNCKIDR